MIRGLKSERDKSSWQEEAEAIKVLEQNGFSAEIINDHLKKARDLEIQIMQLLHTNNVQTQGMCVNVHPITFKAVIEFDATLFVKEM